MIRVAARFAIVAGAVGRAKGEKASASVKPGAYDVPMIQPMSFGDLESDSVKYAPKQPITKDVAIPDPGAYEAECYLPLDMMFLQDTTGSFYDDLPNVLRQIPDMVALISSEHPKSRFGVAEFKDKPFEPLGLASDFCYKLNDGNLSSNVEDFLGAYKRLYASGGEDVAESQYQALIDVALDERVGWRPLAAPGVEAQENEAGARLVVISTDARPHDPKDCNKYDPSIFLECPRNLPPNSGTISTDDISFECIYQDYPSCYQMRDVLVDRSVTLVIVTPNDPYINPVWKWINEDLLQQPTQHRQFIRSDSLDLFAKVIRALKSVTSSLCPDTSSTMKPTVEASSSTSTTRGTTTPVTSRENTTPEATTQTYASTAELTTAEAPGPTGQTGNVSGTTAAPPTLQSTTTATTTSATMATTGTTRPECPPCECDCVCKCDCCHNDCGCHNEAGCGHHNACGSHNECNESHNVRRDCHQNHSGIDEIECVAAETKL